MFNLFQLISYAKPMFNLFQLASTYIKYNTNYANWMEKEKGRTLTKHEMTTTIKALMKYNSKKRKSLKKRENKKKQKTEGEGAEDEVESEEEEIDFDMDEDELEAFKATPTLYSLLLWSHSLSKEDLKSGQKTRTRILKGEIYYEGHKH